MTMRTAHKYYWTSGCGRIELELAADQINKGFTPGKDTYHDIIELKEESDIKTQLDLIAPHLFAEILREYGAWDNRELQFLGENKIRLLWIACGDLYETLND